MNKTFNHEYAKITKIQVTNEKIIGRGGLCLILLRWSNCPGQHFKQI